MRPLLAMVLTCADAAPEPCDDTGTPCEAQTWCEDKDGDGLGGGSPAVQCSNPAVERGGVWVLGCADDNDRDAAED